MAPDYLYLFPGVPNEHYGHTLPGIFTFSLPAGLFALWLWHAVMKRPLLCLMPRGQQQRLIARAAQKYPYAPMSRFLLIALAVLFGVVTHVLLDGFTHSTGYFVKEYAFLRQPVTILGHTRAVHWLLNYGISAAALVVMALIYVRWIGRRHPREVPKGFWLSRKKRAAIFIFMAALMTVTTIWLGSNYLPETLSDSIDVTLRSRMVGAMRGFLWGLVVVSIALTPRARRAAREMEDASRKTGGSNGASIEEAGPGSLDSATAERQ